MKTKIFLSILAFGLIVSTFSQKSTIELTFTAENNGQYVPLDSIFIENLTQGGDTTLYVPDTVLVMDYTASIRDDEDIGKNTFSVSQNYPNPFYGKTTVNLYLQEKEYIKITVRDILGRELTQYENTLNRGDHSFAFYSGNEKYYLFTVTGKQTSKTIKMLNANDNITFGGKCKIVYSEYEDNVIGFKSQKAINNFIFNLGDELLFVGYSDLGESGMIDTPSANQTYTFQFATNIPCPGTPTITYEGNVYNTVLIGSQCWLKENLNVGTMINCNEDMTDNGIIEKYCYNNTHANCDTYGGLYQWNEMMQYTTTPGVQGICPTGWHIPSDAELTLLTDFLGGESVAGGKMKEVGTTHWNSPNTGATNDSGFTALPGGCRGGYGLFFYLGSYGTFWSSTKSFTLFAWCRLLYCDYTNVDRNTSSKFSGFSVRCVQD